MWSYLSHPKHGICEKTQGKRFHLRRTKANVYVLYYNHIQTNSVNNDKETIIKVLEYILDTCMVSIINES